MAKIGRLSRMYPFEMALRASFQADIGAFSSPKTLLNCYPDAGALLGSDGGGAVQGVVQAVRVQPGGSRQANFHCVLPENNTTRVSQQHLVLVDYLWAVTVVSPDVNCYSHGSKT